MLLYHVVRKCLLMTWIWMSLSEGTAFQTSEHLLSAPGTFHPFHHVAWDSMGSKSLLLQREELWNRSRDMIWSPTVLDLYPEYNACDVLALLFLWRCMQRLGRFVIRDLGHAWAEGGRGREAEPIRGSLTWTRVRRTRKGRRWERKTDRWERRG